MLSTVKLLLTLGTVVTGAAVICPLCTTGAGAAPLAGAHRTVQTPDTSLVRLHISGMTCGSCPTTARLALGQVAGVYSAKVTLDDSLGVVRYDPGRVEPSAMIAYLARMTGFRATILPDSSAAARPSRIVRPQ